jgi:hypothetical protein
MAGQPEVFPATNQPAGFTTQVTRNALEKYFLFFLTSSTGMP